MLQDCIVGPSVAPSPSHMILVAVPQAQSMGRSCRPSAWSSLYWLREGSPASAPPCTRRLPQRRRQSLTMHCLLRLSSSPPSSSWTSECTLPQLHHEAGVTLNLESDLKGANKDWHGAVCWCHYSDKIHWQSPSRSSPGKASCMPIGVLATAVE
jgi:hypothetical protein